MINLVVLPLVLAGLLSNPEFVQCHLAKRVKIQGEMVCIYRGPNGTIGYHYPMFKFSECPKTYMCRYTPNAKKRVILFLALGVYLHIYVLGHSLNLNIG